MVIPGAIPKQCKTETLVCYAAVVRVRMQTAISVMVYPEHWLFSLCFRLESPADHYWLMPSNFHLPPLGAFSVQWDTRRGPKTTCRPHHGRKASHERKTPVTGGAVADLSISICFKVPRPFRSPSSSSLLAPRTKVFPSLSRRTSHPALGESVWPASI